ncbi:MAG: UDP-N-acetylmuramate--L-alanine ligase [Prevotellaceae bacterium]|nr:UDP-N-acetylmuramate--L-alanine ligase [Prevotellaceae bacterium]
MEIKSVYFIGAGGIGMSALERYFLSRGLPVGGYDRTPTELTQRLCAEGACIHFEDNPDAIAPAFRNADSTLVVYTPAIPADNRELAWFRAGGFEIQKRAQVLGTLTRQMKGLCVAGTHGKTTTSSMAAHLLHESAAGCNAFLGGIVKNYGSNCLLSPASPYVVIEADEFDRSFHHLRPYATVVTSADADHLDIYGTEAAYLESFAHYTSLVQPGGALVVHRGLRFEQRAAESVRRYDYSRDEGDFHAENIRMGGGRIVFDLVSPFGNIADVELGVPVSINIDNGIAAMALAQIAGLGSDEIRAAMKSFGGVDRRFDFQLNTPEAVLLSDYAHHPEEIRQSLRSVREVFAGRRLTAVFQPHLYSRTRDFYREFADALSLADEVWLLPVYPARELPIEGVDSAMIAREMAANVPVCLVEMEDLAGLVEEKETDVVMLLGAGDVESRACELADVLRRKKGLRA